MKINIQEASTPFALIGDAAHRLPKSVCDTRQDGSHVIRDAIELGVLIGSIKCDEHFLPPCLRLTIR